jgi:RNA processing factor Prp31
MHRPSVEAILHIYEFMKYGLLYHSTFIGRAGPKHKGRISRFLANKCSIASRIDCYSGTYLVRFSFVLMLKRSEIQTIQRQSSAKPSVRK